MNSGSGMMRIGVTVPIISIIAIFLVLNMFFGAWILALPLAAAAAFLIFFLGANRLVKPNQSFDAARAQGSNLFGLPDLPRFYGFLHVFCWFIPPVIFLILWQFFGNAWIGAQFNQVALSVMGVVNVDYEGMSRATRELFAHYFFSTPLSPDVISYSTGFNDAFASKYIARRWFWVALTMGAAAIWQLSPTQYDRQSTRWLPVIALIITAIALYTNGFAWLSYGVGIVLAICLVNILVRRSAIGGMMGKIFMLAGGLSIIVWLHDLTQWGSGGWIFASLLLAAALATIVAKGDKPSLRSATWILAIVAFSAFVLSSVVSVLDMLGWVQTFVATDFGRPSPGALSTEGSRVLRIFGEIKAGNEITPQLLKKARATQEYVDAAYRWLAVNERAQMIVYGGVLASLVLGALLSVVFIKPTSRARQLHENAASTLLIAASALAVLVTVGLVLALLGQAEIFFAKVPAQEFFNELTWSKGGIHDHENGIRKSKLGAIPVFYGTIMISLVALAFAVPVGLFSAIYMSEYAGPRVRAIFKPILEILAGVPTIVYGVFALLIVGPVFRDVWDAAGAPLTGYEMAGRSATVAGFVMGIMLIPFISSLSDDALKAVPRPLRDGSLALGANKSETILKVLLPAALPGIMGGILLATSRAIGETMIVVLAAGRHAQIKVNPLEPMTTVTVQIVEFLTGDTAFDSPETLSAYGLGLVLFLATLVLNMVAIVIVRRYRLKYS